MPVGAVLEEVELGAVDPVEGPTVGTLELVWPGELVEVLCPFPFPVPVDGLVVGPDWPSGVTGSVVLDVVVDALPLAALVPVAESLPPVVEAGPELLVAPGMVLEGV